MSHRVHRHPVSNKFVRLSNVRRVCSLLLFVIVGASGGYVLIFSNVDTTRGEQRTRCAQIDRIKSNRFERRTRSIRVRDPNFIDAIVILNVKGGTRSVDRLEVITCFYVCI